METNTILMDNLIPNHAGVLPEDGESIYKMLFEHFQKGEAVELDFNGVELLTTACLNVAIGKLYKDYSSEQLQQLLKFKHIDAITARRIKKVTTYAKVFYSNTEEFTKNVEEVLNGKD